jgi:hypothetical protein
MNLSNIINAVADALDEAVTRAEQRQERQRDFVDALQEDLRNAAEVVDQINFTALEQLRKAAVAAVKTQTNPLKDAKVDWSQFTDFVNKAQSDFGTVRNPEPSTRAEKFDWLVKNIGGVWKYGGSIEGFYLQDPEGEQVLNRFYREYRNAAEKDETF